MRIWSKKLIPILPTNQLKAMRYELGDMIKQYPNIKHPFARFANNYDISYLGEYYATVLREFDARGINHNTTCDEDIFTLIDAQTNIGCQYIIDNDLTFEEDNYEYLKICLWNLHEKIIRGSIPYDRNCIAINQLFEEECL